MITNECNPTLHVTDSTPYHTVGGRVVYGGGGIFPDHLIPYRKDPTFVYYNKLSSKGILSRVAFEEVRQHAEQWLQRYPTADDFCRHFKLGDNVISRVVKLGEKEDIPVDNKGLSAQSRLMTTMVKAFIGDFLYGQQVFYRIYLPEDEDLKQTRAIK